LSDLIAVLFFAALFASVLIPLLLFLRASGDS